MKSVKHKLAVMVGVFVLLALVLVFTVFNLAMGRQIEAKARESLERTLVWDYHGWEDYDYDDYDSYIYVTLVMILDQDYVPTGDQSNYTPRDLRIANWCQENRETGVVRQAQIDGGSYYIEIGDGGYDWNDGKYTAAYVDVTGEQMLIRSINLVFLFIMVVMGFGGWAAGYVVGAQIEKGQEIQKKFYENMSHELKTPLTAIQGYAEGVETGILEDSRQAARVISGETRKMSRMVEEILCLARLESGAVKLRREPVDVGEFVEDCLLPLEGAIRKRGLEVELQIGDGAISADPEQLEHALMNVLTNAIKYADNRIVLRYEAGVLTVWNDGDRLSNEDMGHLFDRFYTGKGGKTGVGLALAKEIVELHGWSLHAKRADDGICFIFTMGK